MFEGALRDLRQAVRKRRYIVTLHAEEEMAEDGLTVSDVEPAILTGEAVERQRKGTVAKCGPTGKMTVITVCLA